MVEEAHRLAVEAEDLHDDGHLQLAAARFEKAAEAYVRATLSTNDTASLQSLRLLALKHSQVLVSNRRADRVGSPPISSHAAHRYPSVSRLTAHLRSPAAQRAHELKWLVKLHSLPLEDAEAAAQEALASADPHASTSRQQGGGAANNSVQLRGSSGSGSSSTLGSASHGPPPEWSGEGAGSALLRLGSTLLGTLETLRLGAEDLVGCDLVLPPAATGGTTSALGAVGALGGSGSALMDSFCVVNSQSEQSIAGGGAAAYAAFTPDRDEVVSEQMSSMLAATRHKLAQVTLDVTVPCTIPRR